MMADVNLLIENACFFNEEESQVYKVTIYSVIVVYMYIMVYKYCMFIRMLWC